MASDTLSGLEWTVVQLARSEAETRRSACGEPRSPLMAKLRHLVDLIAGRRGSLPLANPRLEALRRFACSAATGGVIRDDELGMLVRAGFSGAQAQAAGLAVARRQSAITSS